MSSDENSESRKTSPRYSDTLSESTDGGLILAPLAKLPNVNEIDPGSFHGIEDVGKDYKDPIKLHKMLIDERIRNQQNQTDKDLLMEQYNKLNIQLNATKKVGFEDRELTQAEKDEINMLKHELQSTRIQLDELQHDRSQSNGGAQTHGGFQYADYNAYFEPQIPPAELEMVRATVIQENKSKPNFDRMTSLEEEIEKYRSLYNDIRSKYTILSADFEHQQIEHRDQIDSVQFNSNCRIRDAEKEKSDFKKQHGELKKYANNQIDQMKNEMTRLREQINSYKIEAETANQNRIQSLKDIDFSINDAAKRAMEAENGLKVSKLEISRLNDLLDSRTAEAEGLRGDLKKLKMQLEEKLREIKSINHQKGQDQMKFKNENEIIKTEFGKEINQLKIELEKFKSAYRKANSQLEIMTKNADKRSQMAENAEKIANEKIEDIKREQWSMIEKIKSEKRETDSLLQKEMDEKSKISSEYELYRDNTKSEKFESERIKNRLENQLNTLRDEKLRINAELSEARIRNEQIEELKKGIETEQREKNDLTRQLNDRDLHQRESILEKDSLKSEISNLRQELKIALEEAKRNREEDRINHLEEKNRISQRLDQAELKNQNSLQKISKSETDYDSLKKKYNNRLKSVNEDNLLLKAEKDRITAELELTKQTTGVSKVEYERVKKRMVTMQKRMQQFAQAMYQSDVDIPAGLLSPQVSMTYGLSPRKTMSNQSLLMPVSENPSDISLINKRLDQMELDQIRQQNVFDKTRDSKV